MTIFWIIIPDSTVAGRDGIGDCEDSYLFRVKHCEAR